MEGQGIASSPEVEELRELLHENLKLAKDTNKILHSMRYWGRVSFWAKVVVWCLILSIPFLLYSYFAPLLKTLPGGLGSSTSTSTTSIFGFPSPTAIEHLFQGTSK